MGLLGKFFNQKSNVIELASPIEGNIISLSQVPDEAFSSGTIGDGVAIIPTGDTIYAPCDAEEINIFATNHAISFEIEGELELIVHFGIDTVKLNGKGFTRIAKDGSSVKKGDPLIKFDLDFITNNAKSIKTPVIIANMELVESISKSSGKINVGETIMTIKLKK